MDKKRVKPSQKIAWEIPTDISRAIRSLQEAVNDLAKIARHKQKSFTLDGRLIGDIGEVIAAYFFDLELNEIQQTGYDATILSGPNKGQRVEVKCRRKSDTIHFVAPHAFLIVLKIDDLNDQKVDLVYAGPGSVIGGSVSIDEAGKFSKKISVKLSTLNKAFNVEAYLKDPVIPFSNEGRNTIL